MLTFKRNNHVIFIIKQNQNNYVNPWSRDFETHVHILYHSPSPTHTEVHFLHTHYDLHVSVD